MYREEVGLVVREAREHARSSERALATERARVDALRADLERNDRELELLQALQYVHGTSNFSFHPHIRCTD